MNLLWIQRRHEDAITRRKEDEVQQRVNKWTMDRSRDESELLRRRESMKLVAGLERTHRQDLDDRIRGSEKTAPTHETRCPPPGDARAERSSGEASSDPVSTVKMKTSPLVEEYLRTGGGAPIVVLKQSVRKADVKTGGGMHFRNELPANYTPPSRHSNQSSSGSSAASWRDRAVAAPSSASTPSSFVLEKKTHPLHAGSGARRGSTASSGSSGFSDDSGGDSTDDERTARGESDPVVESGSRLSPRVERPTRRRMKLEPYHIPYFASTTVDAHAAAARSGPANTLSFLKVRGVGGWVEQLAGDPSDPL
ncbi:hypothetical protein PybrP1_003170 [[Pythium] brassicae (nom. inval.)]|nr:hypothetical protein PybrP1_003170 [[Pythium] brassicae (nom. inval.)]